MKPILTALYLTLNCFLIEAQHSYIIRYHVDSNNYEYFREKNGNAAEKLRRIKLNEGDVLRMQVVDFNPFRYHIRIRQKPVVNRQSDDLKLLDEAKVFFGKSAEIMDFIGTVQLPVGLGKPFGSGNTRGSANVQSFFEKYENYLAYLELEKEISKDMNNYAAVVKEYAAILDQLTDAGNTEARAFEEIKRRLQAMLDALPAGLPDKIAEELDASRVAFSKSGLKSINSFQQDENLRKLYMQIKNDYASFTGSVEQWLAQLNISDGRGLVPVKISDLIQEIDRMEFNSEAIFAIDRGNLAESENLELGAGTEVFSDIDFTVEVYDLKKMKESTPTSSRQRVYVKYPNKGVYWDPENQPTKQPCLGCRPMIKAEGIVEASFIPERIDEIIDEDGELEDICVGKWIIYDDQGNMERILFPPLVRDLNKKPEDGRNIDLGIESYDEIRTSLDLRRNIRIPMAGTIGVNWTTGIMGIGAFGGRFDYALVSADNGSDSVRVTRRSLSPFNFALGSMMSLDFLSGRHLTPSMNLGLAIDVSSGRYLNYLIGVSLKSKKLPMMALTSGIAYTYTNALNPSVSLNRNYDEYDLYKALDSKDMVMGQYRLGYYFGLNVSLR